MIDVLAHGVGGRTDLPVPFWLALYGAGAAVVFSFAALYALWRQPRLKGDEAGRPLPRWLAGTLDSPVFRGVLRAVVLALAVLFTLAAFLGAPEPGDNPTPWVFYITFWVGLVPFSLLFGPVWRVVNPLRTIHAGLSRLAGGDPEDGLKPLPERLGYWPAAAWLGVFLWFELVHPDRANPRLVGLFLATYAVANLVAALVYGSRWFERGDGFEAYSTLVGSMAFIGRRRDGALVWRSPLDGLAAIEAKPGLVAVVVLLLGGTAYDGVTRQQWWQDIAGDATGWAAVPLSTFALVLCVVVVALTYVLATLNPGPARFAHSLVPIAVGYTVAHYFTLFLFEGQQSLVLASDPFDTGQDLLGTARWALNYDLVSTRTTATVQVVAIVTGHVLGVIAAHDRAIALMRDRDAVRGQLPLLAVMVGYTIAGVALLLGT